MSIQLLYLGDNIGCARDLLYVGERSSAQVDILTTREITRVNDFWNQAKEVFDKYDVIVVSDPEHSRELITREVRSHIIVWICRRITANNDETLYEFLRNVPKDRVTLVPSNEIERIWCNKVGIFVTRQVMEPLGCMPSREADEQLAIKFNLMDCDTLDDISDSEAADTYIVVPSENNTKFIDLCALLKAANIKVTSLKWRHTSTLQRFKGIVHLPDGFNTWFANEALAQNIISFVPSPAFLFELTQLTNNINKTPYFFNVDGYGGQLLSEHVTLCNWYNYDGGRIYFSSFEDLIRKITTLTDQDTINALKVEAQREVGRHKYPTTCAWNALICQGAKKAGWKPESVPRWHTEHKPEVISTVKYLKCISAPEI